MQPSHHRYYVSGQKAARAQNLQDSEKYNQERNWLKTALAMEQREQREDAQKAYERGFAGHRQISGGMYV